MNLPFVQKQALVCGASQGIGWASARLLAETGAQVTLLARNTASLQEKVALLPNPTGTTHDYQALDLSHRNERRAVLAAWDTSHYDILVANAGGPPPGTVLHHPTEAYEAASESLLYALQDLVAALVPGMKARG